MVHGQIVKKRFANRHSHTEVDDALYYESKFCPLSAEFRIPGGLTYEGVKLPTVAHHVCYQVAKQSNNVLAATQIAAYYTTIANAYEIASGVRVDERWTRVAAEVHINLAVAKFSNPPLRDFLLATGEKTIYRAVRRNRNDGIGINEYFACRGAKHRGQNCFGRVLMRARERLRDADRD